jgi:polyphosphate kinase
MPRNFFRRVEVMFPILSEEIKDRVRTEIIPAYLRDNVKARQLQADGKYTRVKLAAGDPKYRVQQELLDVHRSMAVPPVVNPNSQMKRRKDRKGKGT